jgi:hypothetical protein
MLPLRSICAQARTSVSASACLHCNSCSLTLIISFALFDTTTANSHQQPPKPSWFLYLSRYQMPADHIALHVLNCCKLCIRCCPSMMEGAPAWRHFGYKQDEVLLLGDRRGAHCFALSPSLERPKSTSQSGPLQPSPECW